MSDVHIAPPAAPSAPSAPPSSSPPGGVPINQDAPHIPTPVGPQAPSKPAGEGGERPSRREVIQEAFRKAEEKGRPGPAQARPGHNQPPEETPRERPAQRPEQHREAGRFARAPDAPGAAVREPTGQPGSRPQPGAQPHQQAPQQQYAPLPEAAPYRAPPPRFSRRAQADWAGVPESVRGDIYRMHHEVGRMHQQYRADSQVMQSVRPYHDLATSQGTTLQRALHNYVNMEKKLREDAISGLDIIVTNLNLRDQQGRKLGLRDIAYYVLTQSPDAHKMVQSANQQQAHNFQIGALHQKIDTLARGVQQMHHERQFAVTRSAVDQFAEAHPRFDELGDLIERELRLGFSLEQAYRRAELLRPPTTRAAQTRTQPAQNRAERSISGAPDGPSNGHARQRSDKPVERRAAIANAIKRVNGGV